MEKNSAIFLAKITVVKILLHGAGTVDGNRKQKQKFGGQYGKLKTQLLIKIIVLMLKPVVARGCKRVCWLCGAINNKRRRFP